MNQKQDVLRYGPSSGSFLGFVGLAICALVVGMVVADDLTHTSVRVGIAAAAFAALIWAYLLRPRIIVETGTSTLVLRNPLSSWRIPLASVRVVGVKTVTTVKTDDARFDAVAVGYPLRKVVRGNGPGAHGPSMTSMFAPSLRGTALDPSAQDEQALRRAGQDEQTVMTETILAAAEQARVQRKPETPAVRSYAVVEIALVALAAVAFVATFLF